MTQKRHVLTVFASSPGDVPTEREHVTSIVNELNLLWSRFLEFHIDLLQDQTHTYPSLGSYVQDVVNRQIGDSYNIYVGIMADRVGTPTPVAPSGTVEEFERALARYLGGESDLQIMFFFRAPKLTMNDDAKKESASAVDNFRQRIKQLGVYYRTYQTSPEFLALFRLSLTLALQDWLKRNGIVVTAQPELPTETDALQEEVNERKYRLDEVVLEMTDVMNRLGAAMVERNAALQHVTSVDDVLAQAAADINAFTKDMKRLAVAFSMVYSEFLDSASRVASNLASPNLDQRRKAALTVIILVLLGIDENRAKVHNLLFDFHNSMGGLKALRSYFASALAGGLEAIEALLVSFEVARRGVSETVETINPSLKAFRHT